MQSDMVKEDEAAKRLGIAVATLRTWRSTRRVDLRYYKFGKAVRYRVADLEAFIQSAASGGAVQ